MTEYIECECGMIVKGKTLKHVKACLIYHKKSTKHKEQLEARKIIREKDISSIDNSFSKGFR